MRCQRARKWMTAAVDGELSPRRRRAPRGEPRGGPGALPPPRRIAKGPPPAEPPAKLAEAPDLFVDMPIIRNLDKMTHFEAIQTTTLDDEPATPDRQEPPSNG